MFCTTSMWYFQKLPSYTFYGCCVHVFLFPFFIFTLVAASISHFLTAAKKFSCFSANEIGPRCFFYFSLWLLLMLSTLMKTLKFSRKKDSASFFFPFKTLACRAIYRRNARGAWNAKFHPSLHEWVNVHNHAGFLHHGAPLRAFRCWQLLLTELNYGHHFVYLRYKTYFEFVYIILMTKTFLSKSERNCENMQTSCKLVFKHSRKPVSHLTPSGSLF